MKKTVLFCALAAGFGLASAQEVGRVISSTPIVQQVAVPQQVCGSAPVVAEGPRSGGGAVLGAIVGGVLGHTVGGGLGTVAATFLGAAAGASVGDSIEGRNNAQVVNATQCSTQTSYQPRTVAYNVTYEYGGKQYTTQMAQDPGQTIQMQVRPQGAMDVPPVAGNVQNGQPAYAQAPVYTQQYTQPTYVVANAPVVYSAPYYAPAYYAPSYYAPAAVAIGVGLGFGGYYGHRRHWR